MERSRADNLRRAEMINQALFTSNSDEYETPQELFDKLDSEFHFELDVCATSENHKCKKYFTKLEDGLSQNWGGTRYGAIRLTPTFLHGLEKLTRKAAQKIQLS